MVRGTRQPFDGGNFSAGDRGQRNAARPRGPLVDVHRASAAKRRAAAELGARQAKLVSQHPKQRHVRTRIDLTPLTVDEDCGHRSLSLALPNSSAMWLPPFAHLADNTCIPYFGCVPLKWYERGRLRCASTWARPSHRCW